MFFCYKPEITDSFSNFFDTKCLIHMKGILGSVLIEKLSKETLEIYALKTY